MRSRLLVPALLAIVSLGTMATGAFASQDIRADQRRAAAVAKEKRALAAYRGALGPIAIRVFDAVQPLQDTFDDDAKPIAGDIEAQFDVIQHGGALPTLTTTKASLTQIAVPAAMRAASRAAALALDGLVEACRQLDKASRSNADKAGFVDAFFGAYDKLHEAETRWLVSLQQVYGDKVPLPVPAEDRVLASGRKVSTHGGFIARADVICARMAVDLHKHNDFGNPVAALRNLTLHAGILRRGTTQLTSIPTPPSDAAFLHRLRVQLAGAQSMAAAFDGIVAGQRARDQAALDRAQEKLALSLVRLRDASRSFDHYGATLCGDVFNVDELLAPKATDQLRA